VAHVRTKSGKVLRERDIERLAGEAEAGYDLTRAKRVRTGRPSLGGDGESPRVQIRFDPTLARELRSRAPGRSQLERGSARGAQAVRGAFVERGP
jgi:hypothetical protein